MSDDLEKAVDEYRNSYGWRARLERFRSHLDKLPDQRRRIPIKGGHKTGPRVEIEKEIDSAERAGEAGDLDAFAQAMHRIVGDFFEAGVPIFVEADYRKRQSKRASGPRKRQSGLAIRGLMAMLDEWPDLDAPTMRNHLEGHPRDSDERNVKVRLDDDGTVVVTDLADGSQDLVPKEYQANYLKRARDAIKKDRQNR